MLKLPPDWSTHHVAHAAHADQWWLDFVTGTVHQVHDVGLACPKNLAAWLDDRPYLIPVVDVDGDHAMLLHAIAAVAEMTQMLDGVGDCPRCGCRIDVGMDELGRIEVAA